MTSMTATKDQGKATRGRQGATKDEGHDKSGTRTLKNIDDGVSSTMIKQHVMIGIYSNMNSPVSSKGEMGVVGVASKT
jgi:hypothetical protein